VARYEDSGVHGYPQAAELRPAEDVLEGQAGGSPVHHGSEVGGRPCREMSNRASSSAKTQPAARSLVSARPGHPTFRVGGQDLRELLDDGVFHRFLDASGAA
jgi:hypothetical protein